MGDAVRPSPEKFRLIYEEGYKTWAQIYLNVVQHPKPPTQYLAFNDALQQYPVFPRNLSPTHDKRGVISTGSSLWGATGATDGEELPPFQQPIHTEMGIKDPIPLSMSCMSQEKPPYGSLFTHQDDYIGVLILAWTYILSARWAEVISETCSLTYTNSEATAYNDLPCQDKESRIIISIGDVSTAEARWWAAILAPGRGWEATMKTKDTKIFSPWSVHLTSQQRFAPLQTTHGPAAAHPAASSSDARSYLEKFCVGHDIIDQCHASLSAVLLLPSMAGSFSELPIPRIMNPRRAPLVSSYSDDGQQSGPMHMNYNLDKLLTLSCHSRGIRPMLLSIFYSPEIECNAVTPWLQGTLAAIYRLANNEPSVIGRMCMARSPRVAHLWLGSLVIGLQDKLLREVRFGQIPLDLCSAAWSRTVQSFIQQPVPKPLTVRGNVLRADECRLLFLSQVGQHSRIPVCQWRPFGATRIRDANIETRLHEECDTHQLQYRGTLWECEDGGCEFQPPQDTDSQMALEYLPAEDTSGCQISVFYGALDQEKDFVSKNATRSIFGWLRFGGWARHEQEIWKHEWFDMYDSDEDEDAEEESCGEPKPQNRVMSWLSGNSATVGGPLPPDNTNEII